MVLTPATAHIPPPLLLTGITPIRLFISPFASLPLIRERQEMTRPLGPALYVFRTAHIMGLLLPNGRRAIPAFTVVWEALAMVKLALWVRVSVRLSLVWW